MKEVILNGFIGEKYGRNWHIEANNVTDVFSCIDANYPSFKKDMIEYLESGGDVSVQSGNRFIEEEDLLYTMPEDTMIITPVPAGAKGGGAKLLLGALLVASFFIPGSSAILLSGVASGSVTASASAATLLAAGSASAGMGLSLAGYAILGLGASLALAGITQLMAPKVETEGPGDSKYLFNGPENTIPQNNVVPVLFGEMIVGGVVIASGTISGLQNRAYSYVTYPGSTVVPGGGTFVGAGDFTYVGMDTFGGGLENRSLWV